MRKLVVIAIALILLIIENTILPYYSFLGAFPSILFVFAIAYSIVNGKWEAIFIGTVSGFLQDIYFFKGFGVNMFLNLLLCILAANIGESIFKQNRVIPVISCFIISVLKVFGMAIIMLLFKESINVVAAILSSLMNMVVMFFGYKIVLTASKKYITKDTWRFR